MAKHKVFVYGIRNKKTGKYWTGTSGADVPTDNPTCWTADLQEAKTFYNKYLYRLTSNEEIVKVEVEYTLREVGND